MGQAAPKNKGFSLIELMFAILIIMISMLALLTSIMTSINTNMQNDLRNTGVRLANQTAEALLALPLTDGELSDTLLVNDTRLATAHARVAGDTAQGTKGLPNPVYSTRQFQKTYTISWDVKELSPKLKELRVTVSYLYKNVTYSNGSVVYRHISL